MTRPVKEDRPASHFLRKDNGLRDDLLYHNEVKTRILREAFEVIERVRKIKIKMQQYFVSKKLPRVALERVELGYGK